MYKTDGMAYEVPLISIRYARRFIRFMESRGVGEKALLQGVGLSEKELTDPETFLSMRQITAVLWRGMALLDDERAPFQFGQQLDLLGHGLLGFALLRQRDHRELVSMIVQYLRVSLPIVEMQVHCYGDQIRIGLRDVWDLGDLRPFMLKVYMGSIHSLSALICRRSFFEFDFPTGLGTADWKSVAEDAEMVFGTGANQVVLPLSGRPARDDDAALAYYLAGVRSREEVRGDETMEVVVRVRQHLMNHPGRDGTLEKVAEKMGMSARTIRYHLKLAGFSFHDIRNDIRKSFATRYLTDTRMPMQKIAEIVGYSDQASFTKAYRSWTGKTPGEIRKSVIAS